MNDQRTSYTAKDKRSLLQWIHIQTTITFLVRETGPLRLVLVDLTAGRQADEIWLDFKILTILYRSNYLDCYFVYSSTMLLIVLEIHFSLLFSNKLYCRVCNIWQPIFSCQSLLLGTSVPDDKKLKCYWGMKIKPKAFAIPILTALG